MEERLKKVRKALNLTQAQFAKALGLSWSSIAQIETSKRNPSNRVIKLVCLKYSVQEEWLRTGAGEMFATPEPPVEPTKRETLVRYILDVAAELSEENREILLDAAQKLAEKYPRKKPTDAV